MDNVFLEMQDLLEADKLYKSPIEVFAEAVAPKVAEAFDSIVWEAIVKTNVVVDRDELVKALECDRDQWRKGFANGVEYAKPKWISVHDRLPEKGQLVAFIPTNNTGSVYVGRLSCIGKRDGVMFNHREGRFKSNYYAKWWMPLPEAPKEDA